MRRKEFTVVDTKEINQFLEEMSFGFLGTWGEDGWPHITPLNYVYFQGNLYFHGSKIGQKMIDLKQNNRVTFSVAKEYAVIPSYFSGSPMACPATTYFKSVNIKGYAFLVEDLKEKAEVFTALMHKLQPDGGYLPIRAEDEAYAKSLNAVALVKIMVEDITAKFKFGQNMDEQRFEKTVTGLQERQKGLDLETIEWMKKLCPHHEK